MGKDIVPELLEVIESEMDDKILNNKIVRSAIKALTEKKATYKDANEFAIAIGETLADVLGINLTKEALPEGRMYYNIAERILNPTMSKNYELISNFSADVQAILNRNAGLKLKGKKTEINQSRIDGIINRVAKEPDFEKIKWILKEPIVNFSQSIVDDTIQENVKFHAKAGLQPKIVRTSTGKCCDWCEKMVGTYDYPDVPEDIYRRHRYCRCTVNYNPGDGKRQNVGSKKWKVPEKDGKIEKRKKNGSESSNTKIRKTKHSRIRQSQRKITDKDINIALEKPIHTEPIEVDSLGRKSQKVIGEFTTVIINPDNKAIITTYDTKERIRNKFIKKSKEGDK